MSILVRLAITVAVLVIAGVIVYSTMDANVGSGAAVAQAAALLGVLVVLFFTWAEPLLHAACLISYFDVGRPGLGYSHPPGFTYRCPY